MGRQSRIKKYRTSRVLLTPRDLTVWVVYHCRERTRIRAGLITDKHEARGRYDKHATEMLIKIERRSPDP